MNTMLSTRRSRGFLLMDTLMGIAIATALLMAMTAAVIHQDRAERHLAAVRAAARSAESALLSLQDGQTPPDARTQRLPDPAPPGQTWIRLTVPASGDLPAASLTGLVPTAALAPAPQTPITPGGAR